MESDRRAHPHPVEELRGTPAPHRTAASPRSEGVVSWLLTLQRSAGNRAVAQLVRPQHDGVEGETPHHLPAPIVPDLTYWPTVTQEGPAPPSKFGETRVPWLSEKVDDIGIEGAPQQWWAEGSLFQPITWQVHESAGPDGQENVSDVNSPVITNDNYEEIAADLQPQTSHKYPGKPKQEMFWSRPLVERHELFHCREHKAFTQKRIDQHRAWLAEQTASTAEEARALLDEMLQEVDKDVFKTDMAEPGREKRAYADGSIEFRKLSSEIKLKGATGGYLKSSKGKPLGYPEP